MTLVEDTREGQMRPRGRRGGPARPAARADGDAGRRPRAPPAAKTALKAGIVLYRDTLSSVGDALGIVDEAQRELDAERGSAKPVVRRRAEAS